jgi:hypothetical protein
MKQTAVEWLQFQIDNKDMGEIPMWIYDFCQQAKEMEKEQMEEIREMLVQGALTNMSCASAVVEFDKLTKNK